MKTTTRNRLIVFAVALLVSTVALATELSKSLNLQVQSKLWVGSNSTLTSANAITKSLGASQSLDFGGVTDACENSADITVTGAAVGDACVVGPPATLPSTNSWVFCYVSAASTVKVRHCAHGASGNPSAATYYVRVFSSQ